MINQVQRSLHRRWRKVLLALIIGLATLLAWVSLTLAGRTALLAIDLLSPSSVSLLHALTEPAETTSVAVPFESRTIEARYYQPTGAGPHGAIILALGYPSNIGDPQLGHLAENLARLGYAVLIPQLPGLRIGELVPEDVEALVTAFEWLAARPEISPDHIGFGGFCVGSSFALVAAEDPRINEQVAMVNVFGGYYDLRSFLRATAAHSADYNDQEYPWHPSYQTVALFAQNMILYVNNSEDRALLRQHFEQQAVSEQAPETQTAFGRVAYDLLTTTDPAAVDALLDQIPPDELAKLAAISPSSGIDRLHAKVFIMHDASDPYVPVTESYRLADAIGDPEQKETAHFTLFEHVRPKRSIDRLILVWESIRLVSHLSHVLVEITPEH